MSNLIFSLNIVLPIFFLIVIGFFLEKKGLLTKEFRDRATTLVFYVALPASFINSVASADIRGSFHVSFVLYMVITTLIFFLVIWASFIRLIPDRDQISAAVHGAFRGNFAYIGLAILQSLMNTDVLPASIMIITFVIPLYNVLAVIVLAHYDHSGTKVTVGSQLKALITNPLIIGILIGLPFSLFSIPLPFVVSKTLSYLSQLATPLALLLIGANLKPETFFGKPRALFLASFTKIVAAPLIFTVLAGLLGFRGEELATIFTVYAVPSATNSYIMSRKMNGDADLSAGIIMATSLFSVITMTVGLLMIRTLGLI